MLVEENPLIPGTDAARPEPPPLGADVGNRPPGGSPPARSSSPVMGTAVGAAFGAPAPERRLPPWARPPPGLLSRQVVAKAPAPSHHEGEPLRDPASAGEYPVLLPGSRRHDPYNGAGSQSDQLLGPSAGQDGPRGPPSRVAQGVAPRPQDDHAVPKRPPPRTLSRSRPRRSRPQAKRMPR